jgi:hypothetical protein
MLSALDGTQYHHSSRFHCPRCSTVSKGKKTQYFHSMVQAAIVAPGHNRAAPLQPGRRSCGTSGNDGTETGLRG